MRERVVDLLIDDEPVVTGGLIAEETVGELAKATPEETASQLLNWTQWVYTIVDKSRAAQQQRISAREDLIVDGFYCGDALRAHLRNCGYRDDELAGIPSGAAGGVLLPSPGPGQKSLLRATPGAIAWDYVQSELVERYGLGWELWINSLGVFQWTAPNNRVLDIDWKRPSEAIDSRLQTLAAMQRTRNTDKFFTQILVVGGINPETRQHYSAEWRSNQATDPRFEGTSQYIGHDKPMRILRDPAWDKTYCEIVKRTQVALFGKAHATYTTAVPLNTDVTTGDEMKVHGVDVRLARIGSSSVLDDTMPVELETV